MNEIPRVERKDYWHRVLMRLIGPSWSDFFAHTRSAVSVDPILICILVQHPSISRKSFLSPIEKGVILIGNIAISQSWRYTITIRLF
jgi:hypothetical protein